MNYSYKIRPYTKSDYSMIKGWWERHGELVPPEDTMPLNSTFVLEVAGTPAYSICVLFTNSRGVAYIENFVRNPTFRTKNNGYGRILSSYIDDFIKKSGYTRAVCYSLNEKTDYWYNKHGYRSVAKVSTMHIKELTK